MSFIPIHLVKVQKARRVRLRGRTSLAAEQPRSFGTKPNDLGRKCVRRRPTLPRGGPRSTIGAERLSFRVRDGTGRFPLAMVAETLWRCRSRTPVKEQAGTVPREPHSGRVAFLWQVLGLLVPVSSMHYC